jgi:hypothetical protein
MGRLRQVNQVRVVIIDSMHGIWCADNRTDQSLALRKLYQAADRLKLAAPVMCACTLTTMPVSGNSIHNDDVPSSLWMKPHCRLRKRIH